MSKGRTMKITVPPDLERALAARAHQIGTTPERLALDSLRECFPPSESEETDEGSGKTQQTLADLLHGYVGILHSNEYVPGGAAMSEDTGKKFAAGLLKKRKSGRL
jgi:hypothetical protein